MRTQTQNQEKVTPLMTTPALVLSAAWTLEWTESTVSVGTRVGKLLRELLSFFYDHTKPLCSYMVVFIRTHPCPLGRRKYTMSDMKISRRVLARHSKGTPMYGTELVYDQNATQGIWRVMIITAYFKDNNLVANRSVWKVSELDKDAQLINLSTWTADVDAPAKPEWESSDLTKAWNKHRKALATFLMGQFSLGKLHGRINDTLV